MNIADQARQYREQGKYMLALTCAQTATTISCLAEQSRALNWLGQGEKALQTALLAVNSCTSETTCSMQIDALLSLCSASISNGKYSEALEQAQQAQQKQKNAAIPQEQEAHICMAVATANSCLGHKSIAIKYAQSAIKTAEKTRPRVLAEAFHCLADSFHRGTYFTDAIQAWQRALALRRATLSPQHPEIATTVDGFALSLRRLQQPQLAMTLHREALQIYKHSFPDKHPALAACYHGIAQCCHRLSRFKEAYTNLQLALQLSESILGTDHPDTWITRFELGRIEVDCGHLEQGVQRMEFARMRLAHLLGDQHPTIQAMDKWRSMAQPKV